MEKLDLEFFFNSVQELQDLEREVGVVKPESPEALKNEVSLDLGPACDTEFLYQQLGQLLKHTPKTSGEGFFNQLFGGRHSKAVLGELLSVMLNNSMYTYKVAGPMVLMEKELIQRSAELLGYPEATVGGTIAPGGSMTNLMGMIMARDHHAASVRQKGVQTKMVMYASRECHYSIPKNAAFMGIGRDQLRYIDTDDQGQMDVEALAAQIIEDKQNCLSPFLVVATAGTTVLGAFDPFDEIADLCAEHKLWMHVDGAYCGSVIFSEQKRALVKGAQRADSFSYNAHKMLSTPLSCSLILVKDKAYLYHSFDNDASYLYQTDADDLNPGRTSLQCGRRNDALKFWTLWKSIGTKGLGEMVDHEFALADYALQYVNNHPDYKVYSYPNSIGICFNYKDQDPVSLCNGLYEEGELMIGYGKFEEQTFVRLVTVTASNTTEDIDRFFKKLEAYAEAH